MERIYIHNQAGETTWVNERIDDSDVEYIRADLATAPCSSWEPGCTSGPMTAAELVAFACSSLTEGVNMGLINPFVALQIVERIEEIFGVDDHQPAHETLKEKAQHLERTVAPSKQVDVVAIIDPKVLAEVQ
jgi:hypothetical protein